MLNLIIIKREFFQYFTEVLVQRIVNAYNLKVVNKFLKGGLSYEGNPKLRNGVYMQMNLDLYTAITIQPVVNTARSPKEVEENLERVLTLINSAGFAGSSTAKSSGSGGVAPYAPVKLITLPEFCIQGEPFDLDFPERKKNMLITIPGAETDKLAKKAIELETYIVGSFLEIDPQWPDRQFNTTIVIDTAGDIILKYRKINPAIHFELSASPHDMLEDYIDDSNIPISQQLYPVVDTEIGRIGCLICMDGHFPESFRALALQGAEIIIRANFPEPLISSPNDIWEVQNRSGAHANLAYVVAPMLGGMANNTAPQNITPGHSMIIDYNGMVVARTPYPGEAITGTVINMEQLRRRRLDPSRNFLTLLRTESFRDIYDRSILPPDSYSGGKTPPETFTGLTERATTPIIQSFIEQGIYKKPNR
ncbi:nitrilase-related carbon-nitrogen hydrolase [Aquibacillus saliphilus]|uniref:nitrilase-related carbon-nitrogen hydrolase n=1 Tax=Aquibacillus saliphilus TaxID=1909422 RepID=UPI001CEFCEEC|nr:nitrilase-related carbon-nitrogen hydrolase [Aquibacillus saliphilus]